MDIYYCTKCGKRYDKTTETCVDCGGEVKHRSLEIDVELSEVEGRKLIEIVADVNDACRINGDDYTHYICNKIISKLTGKGKIVISRRR